VGDRTFIQNISRENCSEAITRVDNIKMDLKEIVCGIVERDKLVQGRACEYDDKLSGHIKCGEFIS